MKENTDLGDRREYISRAYGLMEASSPNTVPAFLEV